MYLKCDVIVGISMTSLPVFPQTFVYPILLWFFIVPFHVKIGKMASVLTITKTKTQKQSRTFNATVATTGLG